MRVYCEQLGDLGHLVFDFAPELKGSGHPILPALTEACLGGQYPVARFYQVGWLGLGRRAILRELGKLGLADEGLSERIILARIDSAELLLNGYLVDAYYRYIYSRYPASREDRQTLCDRMHEFYGANGGRSQLLPLVRSILALSPAFFSAYHDLIFWEAFSVEEEASVLQRRVSALAEQRGLRWTWAPDLDWGRLRSR